MKLKNGTVHPPAAPVQDVANLPEDVAVAWNEARRSHAVGAYTASVMMCRKILMHLAVDVAGSDAGKKFVDYIDELEDAGYITKGLKNAVDQIRQSGNIANHELRKSDEEESLRILGITDHLLRGVYEVGQL